VLVNDGQVDVADVAARLAPYLLIRQAEHQAGRGRTVALNAGLAAARGRWITYLDDDDLVYPEHLGRLLGALKDGRAQVAYADANRVLCWSDQERDEVVIRTPCASLDFDRRRLLVDNWIASVAFIHAAACVERVGPFDPALEPFEDWDYLIRLSEACTFAHVAETTYEYRSRFGPIPEGTQSVLRQRERVLEATRRIYARYPTPPGELSERRRLTLAALEQDVEEVREIERSVADPVQRDLLISARVGRFPVSRAHMRRFTTGS
jgi:glycosyltransferase involved in cell wall biosynthesis